MSIEVSQLWLEVPEAGTFAALSHNGTVAVPAQTATATRSAANDIQVSQAWLELPGTVASETMAVSQVWLEIPGDAAARDLSHAGTVPVPTQSAAMFDIVGQINGGGAITEELPHRSLSHAGVVPVPAQAAAIGDATLAPRLITVAQTVPLPTLAAAADAQRAITVSQTVPLPSLDARLRGPAPIEPDVSGGYAYDGKRYRTRVKGRMIYAPDYDTLRRKVLALEDDEPPRKTPRIVRAKVVESPPPDPVEAVRTEMQTQMATLQRQMAELMQQRVQDAQQIAQSYEARVANAEAGTRAALALAQKAQRDAQALAALITE